MEGSIRHRRVGAVCGTGGSCQRPDVANPIIKAIGPARTRASVTELQEIFAPTGKRLDTKERSIDAKGATRARQKLLVCRRRGRSQMTEKELMDGRAKAAR